MSSTSSSVCGNTAEMKIIILSNLHNYFTLKWQTMTLSLNKGSLLCLFNFVRQNKFYCPAHILFSQIKAQKKNLQIKLHLYVVNYNKVMNWKHIRVCDIHKFFVWFTILTNSVTFICNINDVSVNGVLPVLFTNL